MKIYNSTYDGFVEYVKGKDVICYGAGRMLDEMCETLPKLINSCSNILLVDGDEKKWGVKRTLYGGTRIISNPNIVKDKSNTVIIITSAAVREIMERLLDLVDDNTPIFIFDLMRKLMIDHDNISVIDEDEIAGLSEIEQIPRKIHYFWFGGKELPDEYKRNIETWQTYCPDYSIICWDENNCDIGGCSYAKEAYEREKYGFVPDYFRLKIIYEHGGIYLDTDVELLKPLDELLFLPAYVGFEDNNYVNFGAGFGASKNFKLLKEMYEAYENVDFITNNGELNLTPSPIYQTEILKKHGLVRNGKMQIVSDMTILPMNYLTAQSGNSGRKYITKSTLSIHKFAASWLDEEAINKKRFYEDLFNKAKMI